MRKESHYTVTCPYCDWIDMVYILFTGCYPFTDRDPFFVESCPHVYFAGNQDRFGTRLIKGTSRIRFYLLIFSKHFS